MDTSKSIENWKTFVKQNGRTIIVCYTNAANIVTSKLKCTSSAHNAKTTSSSSSACCQRVQPALSQMPLPPLQKYYLASEDESAAFHSEHLKPTKSIP